MRLAVIGALGGLLVLAGCFGPDEIEQPVALFGPEPIDYPIGLWDDGVEGTTLLRVRVTELGAIDSVEVAETSGHAGLDSAAVSGVLHLSFQPGRLNGERAPMWATLPVFFSKDPE